jgi:hypothetical protein
MLASIAKPQDLKAVTGQNSKGIFPVPHREMVVRAFFPELGTAKLAGDALSIGCTEGNGINANASLSSLLSCSKWIGPIGASAIRKQNDCTVGV